MGLLSHSMDALSLGSKSRRSSSAAQQHEDDLSAGREADTEALDKEEGSILTSIIAQLRPGMDLTKIALPTFVLEPRSMLERVTDFFSHPDIIFGAGSEPSAEERFKRVLMFYLSGWHIKPRGVKKPYNPVLNEFYRCMYYYPDGSHGYYIAEQVSHHPPISAFFYVSPENHILVTGELKPKSKFLGNSAATIMEGEDRIRILDRPEDGEYSISMPNTYARGILFGKMILELGDLSTVQSETGYKCDVEFKTKGWVSGGYNIIQGRVRGPNKSDVGELSGMWSGAIDFTEKSTGETKRLFDSATAKAVPKSVLPESMQDELESRRLWSKLTPAIKAADMNAAQAAKSEVEEHQRHLRAEREKNGEPAPQPRFFKPVGDKWFPKLDLDKLPKDPSELDAVVRKFIFGDRVPGPPHASAHGATALPQPSVEVAPVDDPAGGASAPAPATAQGQSPVLAAPAPVPAVASSTAAGAAVPANAQAQTPISIANSASPPAPPHSIAVAGPPVKGPKFDTPPE